MFYLMFTISFIAVVLYLIEREPRKRTNIDLMKMKLIFILPHDVSIDFGRYFWLPNESLSFETKRFSFYTHCSMYCKCK